MFKNHKECHEFIIRHAGKMDHDEYVMIEAMMYAVKTRHHQIYSRASLFAYAMTFTKMTEPKADCYTRLARKACELPQLAAALKKKQISPWIAIRLCAKLKPENVDELLEYARTHTKDEVIDKVSDKPQLQELKRLQKRMREVASQMKQRPVTQIEAQILAAKEWLSRHDPMEKAKRNHKPVCPGTPKPVKVTIKKRQPIPAQTMHAVNLRDQHHCTFTLKDHGKPGPDGKPQDLRCPETKFVHTHHKVLVKDGGTNDLDNLTTLCWFHHDQIHQNQFAFMDGYIPMYPPKL